MPDLVCDTSVLQYLHQLEQLDVLRTLGDRVIVPPAVTEELSEGRSLGVDVPNPDTLQWIDIETPQSAPALPLVTKMGPGEREVLALVLEHPDWVAVLDDGSPAERPGGSTFHLPARWAFCWMPNKSEPFRPSRPYSTAWTTWDSTLP